jgi:hypothetical protein
MMLSVLALSMASSAMAATKVATRTSTTQCDASKVGFGTSSAMSSVLNGCSDMGYLDCTAKTFIFNTTDGLLSCANKKGASFNVTGECQDFTSMTNVTMTCKDIDGTQAASVAMWDGNACNGTSMPLGVFTIGTCTWVTSSNYVKMWTNSTGSFVASYSAAGCGSADQTNIVKLASTAATSGCAVGVLGAGQQSVKWALLETPTSAPTVAGNNTNTSAPKSSGAIVAASLASVVVAAASMML